MRKYYILLGIVVIVSILLTLNLLTKTDLYIESHQLINDLNNFQFDAYWDNVRSQTSLPANSEIFTGRADGISIRLKNQQKDIVVDQLEFYLLYGSDSKFDILRVTTKEEATKLKKIARVQQKEYHSISVEHALKILSEINLREILINNNEFESNNFVVEYKGTVDNIHEVVVDKDIEGYEYNEQTNKTYELPKGEVVFYNSFFQEVELEELNQHAQYIIFLVNYLDEENIEGLYRTSKYIEIYVEFK